MSRSTRLVPVIVASPLFLQNLDSSVMATALPSIAQSLAVPVLHLNLAITAYLLSLAVFLPLSGWLADRYGAKRVFCAAIGLFALASALCASATGLPSMVAFRILQGLGGAMMVPVGRLILLRAIPPGEMVSAMVWFTVPPVLGRMVGPLFGGAIVTITTWHWIFLVNIPFGLLAIAMAWAHIPDESGPARAPVHFDGWGFLLMAAGLGLLMTAIETAGKAMAPVWLSVLAAGTGIACLLAYHRHSRSMAHPLIDLGILRWRTFRTNVLGAAPLRVAIGAMPFLLPLLFQLGFGMSPLQSGLLTMASAVGALATRLVMKRAIIDFGFRRLLLGACGVTGLSYMGYSLWGPDTPHLVVFAALMVGGLVSSPVHGGAGHPGLFRDSEAAHEPRHGAVHDAAAVVGEFRRGAGRLAAQRRLVVAWRGRPSPPIARLHPRIRGRGAADPAVAALVPPPAGQCRRRHARGSRRMKGCHDRY